MELISNTLVRTILISSILLFSGLTYADEDDDDDDEKSEKIAVFTIDTSEYKPTPQVLRNSIVLALLNYNWEIKTIEKNQATAETRHANITVDIVNDSTITLSLTSKSSAPPNVKWLKSINKFLIKEFRYHYYIQQFNK